MNQDLDLFEFLKYVLGCTYISDLRIEPYNTKAKLLLKQLKLTKYSRNMINDVFEYVYSNKNQLHKKYTNGGNK